MENLKSTKRAFSKPSRANHPEGILRTSPQNDMQKGRQPDIQAGHSEQSKNGQQVVRHCEGATATAAIHSKVDCFDSHNDGDGVVRESMKKNPHPNPLPRRGKSGWSSTEFQGAEKTVKNFIPYSLNPLFPQKRVAFTLAEVLITLGVIGVVAAMTIPTLMANYQKHQVETRLKGFYSNINQALRLSEEENGDLDGHIERVEGGCTYEQNRDFLQKYFGPYIKISNYRQCSPSVTSACVDLFDGGIMSLKIYELGYIDIVYIMNGTYENRYERAPRKTFIFRYSKGSDGAEDVFNGDLIKPYDAHWDGTREGLKNSGNSYFCRPGCHYCGHCAKLIQISGWKIPADYPW